MALEVIKEIHGRGKTPIIVGGTNYYIESLLLEKVDQPADMNDPSSTPELMKSYTELFNEFVQKWPECSEAISDFSDKIPQDDKNAIEEKYMTLDQVNHLHSLLVLVDPQMGKYLHSNDKRRIVNALFKFFKMNII